MSDNEENAFRNPWSQLHEMLSFYFQDARHPERGDTHVEDTLDELTTFISSSVTTNASSVSSNDTSVVDALKINLGHSAEAQQVHESHVW